MVDFCIESHLKPFLENKYLGGKEKVMDNQVKCPYLTS
jgi:hypothetical protein